MFSGGHLISVRAETKISSNKPFLFVELVRGGFSLSHHLQSMYSNTGFFHSTVQAITWFSIKRLLIFLVTCRVDVKDYFDSRCTSGATSHFLMQYWFIANGIVIIKLFVLSASFRVPAFYHLIHDNRIRRSKDHMALTPFICPTSSQAMMKVHGGILHADRNEHVVQLASFRPS